MTNYCPECGKELISSNAEICPNCGVRLKDVVINRRSPIIAALLSFFISGLGQIYNGQFGKGVAYIIIEVIFAVLLTLLIGFVLLPIWWIVGIADAYVSAQKLNAGVDASRFINLT